MLSEADYSMTEQAMQDQDRYRGDEHLYVSFRLAPLQDKEASLKEGRPIFNDVEFIMIMVPGDKGNIIDREVREEDKRRFAKQYQAFQNQEKELQSGTPLEKWGLLSLAQCEEMKYFNIRTVEQLAGLADNHAQGFMGIQKLKQQAKEYIDAAASDAPLIQMQADLEERDAKIAEQETALNDLMERIAALEKPAKKGK